MNEQGVADRDIGRDRVEHIVDRIGLGEQGGCPRRLAAACIRSDTVLLVRTMGRLA